MAAETHPQNGDAVHPVTSPVSQSTQNAELAKEEVGWYFVERYYNTLSKNPEKLYLLYNKRSQFVAGIEEEKVHVSIGLKAIDDRVKELEYQDCKVRITNVDSQSSDVNIVVQVIGEMSNGSKPHRKFCQTFVLAPQPHGYFLLNDILRFIADEDEEAVELQSEPRDAAGTTDVDPATKAIDVDGHSNPATDSDELVHGTVQEDEETQATIAHEDPSPEPIVADTVARDLVSEEPTATSNADSETEEAITADERLPINETSPAESSSSAKATPVAAKPAVPLSWAQRIGAGNSSKPSAPTAPTSTAVASPAKVTTTVSANVKSTPAQQPTPVSIPTRQPSPTDSAQDGSQGGWQTAGTEHSKTKSRNHPATTDNGHVRAYVKNVFQSVTSEALKAELSKYGELAYFDVSRQKNSAFVEFNSVEAFKACIAANPHKIGDDSIIVEERRPAPSFGSRGPNRGGRGGSFDGRQGPNRGGFQGKDSGTARGGFNGSRGGRGGPAGVANRGRPQAV